LKEHLAKDEDFDAFMQTIRQKLPITFRLNSICSNFKAVQEKFTNPEYFKRNFFDVDGNILVYFRIIFFK